MNRAGTSGAVVACLWTTACTPEDTDNPMLLVVGTIANSVIHALDDDLYTDHSPVGSRTLTEPSDGAWVGDVALDVVDAGEVVGDCDGAPCSPPSWTVSASFDEITFRDGGVALRDDTNFDCAMGDSAWPGACDRDAGFNLDPPDFVVSGTVPLVAAVRVGAADSFAFSWRVETSHPATLTARSLWLNRTAAVTLDFESSYDEYSNHTTVRGEVDGVSCGYDFASTD